MKFGPQYGYFPEPGKSYYICKANGSAEKKKEWLVGMVDKWAFAVVTLSTVAEWYPQTAYPGFTFCMQNEWQYVQQVVADTALFFSPLEEVICTHFLPALLGVPLVEIDGDYCKLLTHSNLWTPPSMFTRPLCHRPWYWREIYPDYGAS